MGRRRLGRVASSMGFAAIAASLVIGTAPAQAVVAAFPAGTTTFKISGTILLTNTIKPTTNFTGTVNTTTGVVTLTGSLENDVSIALLATTGAGCPLGPIALNFSTADTGGVKYKKVGTHATATVSDTAFTIPTIPSASLACPVGAQNTIINSLHLPATNNASVTQALTIFPPGVAIPTTTTSTIPAVLHGSTVDQGGTLTVTGNGWKPGSTLTFTLHSTALVLGTQLVDVNGAYTAVLTIPTGVAAGAHTIDVAGTDPKGAARTTTKAITVTAILPTTGSGGAFPLTLVGTALVMVGLILMSPRRRRARA